MKNIILLSDGTGNGAAKSNKTNVWRLYEALDLQSSDESGHIDQVAYYDDGVGSQEFLPLKILGGAFGFGLKRNIIELYKFLCRNYDDKANDKIYLFGFSRGAFTVRMLAGLVDCCGLYTGYTDEIDLDEKATNNYYRLRTRYSQTAFSRLFNGLTDNHEIIEGIDRPDIEFIGVWDTVDAYGFPIDEMAGLWDTLIFPIRFPDQKLSTKVKRASHALSIDDERHTFHPVLWDERGEKDLAKNGKVAPDRIEQVWFSGVHSDVGGGYPMNNLSLVTLDWMISKIEVSDSREDGIYFIPKLREEIVYHADFNGKQHDSRSGAGAYYRYLPRDIEKICNNSKEDISITHPKIHRSVFKRIKSNVTTYAPIGLPELYRVVPPLIDLPPYENKAQKQKRVHALKDVQDIVTWRKRLYKALLATSLIFLASRFFLDWSPEKSTYDIECILDLIWVPLIAVLPDFTSAWFEALKQNTPWGWAFIIVFTALLLLKKRLWNKTQIKSIRAWDAIKKSTKARVESNES